MIHTVNLEQGMPTAEQARIRLDQAVRDAKNRRCKALKLIHGYGSSGRGGVIRRDVQSTLSAYKRSGRIREYVPGERFSPFYPEARVLLDGCPALARDRDYAASNHGVTLVLL